MPSVPDYDLLRRVGGGAYGDVWLARSAATGAFRAAKIVWRHKFEDDRPYRREFEGIQRFEQISREHPSQLALFHIGRNDPEGYFYYVMELADDLNAECGIRSAEFPNRVSEAPGAIPQSTLTTPHLYTPHTLRAELEGGRLPASRVLEIGIALAEALTHLHQHGLVHRDVKPSNVIFVNGRPKLADIGLVTDASDQCSIVGTEGYLPPEGPGAPQADIFALGKVLYEAATGMDRREFPKLPEDLRSWPEARQVFELNEIILKASAPDSTQRYGDAGQMRTELAVLDKGHSVRVRRIRQRRIRVTRKAGFALAAAALITAGALYVWQAVKRPGTSVNLVDETGDAMGLHDAKAAEAYKLGLSALRRGTPRDVGLAQNYFNRVIEIEPAFVKAYARLFETYLQSEDHGGPAMPGKTEMLNSLSAKLRQIAPTNAETHAAMAILRFKHEWDWKGAEKEFKEALRIDPNCRLAATQYGYFLTRLGGRRSGDARAVLELFSKRDPTSPEIEKLLGHCDYAQRQFDEALTHYLKAEELDSHYASAYYWAGRACMALTNYSEALQQLQNSEVLMGAADETNTVARYNNYRKAVQQDPGHPALAFWSAIIQDLKSTTATNSNACLWAVRYISVGDKEQAVNWLRKAVERHDTMEYLLFDECWDPYRREQWYRDAVKDAGLDSWQ